MTEETALREVLNDPIDYCRLNRMEEVVDHLMEAQMARPETHPASGDNILSFPAAPRTHGSDDAD